MAGFGNASFFFCTLGQTACDLPKSLRARRGSWITKKQLLKQQPDIEEPHRAVYVTMTRDMRMIYLDSQVFLSPEIFRYSVIRDRDTSDSLQVPFFLLESPENKIILAFPPISIYRVLKLCLMNLQSSLKLSDKDHIIRPNMIIPSHLISAFWTVWIPQVAS